MRDPSGSPRPQKGEQMAQAKADLYRAKVSFGLELDGEQITVHEGDLVRKGHDLLKRCPEHFEEAKDFVRFDVEQATAAPGEKRGSK